MPYELGWYYNRDVVYLVYEGVLTGDEYKASIDHLTAIAAAKGSPVHVISNISKLEKFPPLKALTDVDMSYGSGWIISIGEHNRLVKFFSSTAAQLLGLNLKLVHSEEEAIAVLKRADLSLANVPLPRPIEENIYEWIVAPNKPLLEK